MRTVRTRNNGTRFFEQYEWTIGVCITVQIGERGNFTDVQIGERGKQRVNDMSAYVPIVSRITFSGFCTAGHVTCKTFVEFLEGNIPGPGLGSIIFQYIPIK